MTKDQIGGIDLMMMMNLGGVVHLTEKIGTEIGSDLIQDLHQEVVIGQTVEKGLDHRGQEVQIDNGITGQEAQTEGGMAGQGHSIIEVEDPHGLTIGPTEAEVTTMVETTCRVIQFK